MSIKAELVSSLRAVERLLDSGADLELAELSIKEASVSMRAFGFDQRIRDVRINLTAARRALENGHGVMALRKLRLAIAHAQTEL